MKKRYLCLLLISAISAFSFQKETESFMPENPLSIELGDPFILKASDNIYYLTGTGGVKDGFKMYSSTNLKEWKDLGRIYTGNTESSWCISHFWAPEICEHNGKFYLFFSAQWKTNPANESENFRIGVAVADSPAGPYKDLYNRPVFDPGYPIIDANLLFEGDRTYLYYSRCCYKHPVQSGLSEWARTNHIYDEIEESWIYGVELKPDFSDVIGEPKVLLCPPVSINDKQNEWESRSVTNREANRRWTEGSTIFKRNGVYYMMYSSNYYLGENYAVGYATSKSPLGPFSKADNNPVLQKNSDKGGTVTGTGHNSVTVSPNGRDLLCVYHGRTISTGKERVVFIDKMSFMPNGRLIVLGPTVKK
jgi:beta-xylosidase